jgi:transketolase
MRNYFAREISALAAEMDDVYLVYGDIGNRLFDDFKRVAPNRFVNAGIAEASMISVAAGISKAGFLPFVYTINPFIYLKALEQIKLDVCYPKLPVIMVGTGGGLAYAELGTTHHSLEDVGVLRNVPNLQIFVPSDEIELVSTIRTVVSNREPAYIRIGKKESERVHPDGSNLETLKDEFVLVKENTGASTALVTYGTIATEVTKAYERLETNFRLDLWTAPKLRPISDEFLQIFLARYSQVFIVEEHRSSGGLYSILAEASAMSHLPSKTRLYPINSGDQFHTGLGTQENARRSLKLDFESIVKRVLSEA